MEWKVWEGEGDLEIVCENIEGILERKMVKESDGVEVVWEGIEGEEGELLVKGG